jgi:hypothetical protein
MDEAKDLPYVPPVAEQLAALPANEILLRRSERPIVQRDEFLRAAQAGSTTVTKELLRAE